MPRPPILELSSEGTGIFVYLITYYVLVFAELMNAPGKIAPPLRVHPISLPTPYSLSSPLSPVRIFYLFHSAH